MKKFKKNITITFIIGLILSCAFTIIAPQIAELFLGVSL